MVSLPVKFYEDTTFNFVFNSNLYEIHVGMLYNDSLVIDLDQYSKIFEINMIKFDDKLSLLPHSLVLYNLLNMNHPFLDYFITSSYIIYSLEYSARKVNQRINLNLQNPTVFFIFRDTDNRIWKEIANRYNIILADISYIINRKLVSIKVYRGSCEKRHTFLSTKSLRPIICPICYANGDMSKVITYEEYVYPVYRVRMFSKRYGEIVVYIPKDLFEFYNEVGSNAMLAIIGLSDVDNVREYFGTYDAKNAYFAIGIYFENKYRYDPFVVEDFYSRGMGEKIYLLLDSNTDNLLISLPVMFTLFDKFSVLFVNPQSKYIRSMYSLYNGFTEVKSIDNLYKLDNIIIPDIQYSQYQLRRKIIDNIRNKNIILIYRGDASGVISISDLLHLLANNRVYVSDYVDFIVYARDIFEYNPSGFNVRDVANYVSKVLRSVKFDDSNFEKYFNIEVNQVSNLYKDYADFLFTRKDTILKMSRIFAILDRSNVIDRRHVRYAVAYFSLIHLLPFYGAGLGVLKVFERYKDEIGIFYNYIKKVEEVPNIVGIEDMKNVIIDILSRGRFTYVEIVKIVTDMILSGKVRYSIKDIRLQDAISTALNELVTSNKVKYSDGVYSLL